MDMYALAGLGPKAGCGGAPAPTAPTPAASASEKPMAPPPSWSTGASAATRMLPPKVTKKAAAAPAKSRPAAAAAPTAASVAAAAAIGGGGPSVLLGTNQWFQDIKNPYDPAHPNDYDEWAREKEAARKASELEAALQQKQAEASRKLSSLTAAAANPEAVPSGKPAAGSGGAGLAPPSLPPPPPPPPPPPGVAKRPRHGPQPSPPLAPSVPPHDLSALDTMAAPSGGGSADGTAADAGDADPGLSMLQKMGWSAGQGLGKDGQGMRTPLVAKKMDSATVPRRRALRRARPTPRLRCPARRWTCCGIRHAWPN